MTQHKPPTAGHGPMVVFSFTLLLTHGASAATAPGTSVTPMAKEPAAAVMQPRVLIEPVHRATLSSEIAGRIERLPLREGDAFRKGDLLVGFDCRLYRAEQLAARAEASGADQRLANARQLAEFNSIGGLEVALAESDMQKAKAQLQIADVRVDGCEVRAPFGGRIVELPVRAHESVSVGTELLSLMDTSHLELTLIVPSSWLAWLKRGQAFEVQVDETGGRYAARVTTIGAYVDPVSQSVRIRGTLGNGAADLSPGMSGTALFAAPVR